LDDPGRSRLLTNSTNVRVAVSLSPFAPLSAEPEQLDAAVNVALRAARWPTEFRPPLRNDRDMSTPPKPARAIESVPRLALDRRDAAAAIGMGVTSFEAYVAPELRSIRHGRLVLYPVRELERWVEKTAALTLERR
jgi:hypothetical protein